MNRGDKTTLATITDEEQLLLYCAQIELPPKELDHFTELAFSKINWEEILLAASRHALLPLLYNKIQIYQKALPPSTYNTLKQASFQNCARCLLLTSALISILDRFQQEGIVAVPFKGPVLAVSLYNNISLRSYGDLDILIRHTDISKAYDILLSSGYSPELPLTPEKLLKYAAHEDNLSFFQKGNRVVIELHWDLSGSYLARPLTLQRLQNNLQTITISGTQASSMSDEHLLVYLCVHGAKHKWERLEWICGVASHLRSVQRLDWEAVLNFADELQCKRMLFLGLSLCHTLLNTEFPDLIIEGINKDTNLPGLVSDVYSSLFPLASDISASHIKKRFSSFHMKVRDNYTDSLRYFIRLYFRPTNVEWQTIELPVQVTFLYYFIRPLRLFTGFLSSYFDGSTNSRK